ncbi:hypothetical protein MTO96_028336 [Rhipicephalus appendiculatus]
MSNVATPARTHQQFSAVEPRAPDVDRADSLAPKAALACGVLCVLLGLAVAVSAISFYKQQASFLRAHTHNTSRSTPSARKRAHMTAPPPSPITPRRSAPHVKTATVKTIATTAAEDDYVLLTDET